MSRKYSDVIINAMASLITGISASLAFVREIPRTDGATYKGPVAWKMLPFDDCIMDSDRHLIADMLNGAHA